MISQTNVDTLYPWSINFSGVFNYVLVTFMINIINIFLNQNIYLKRNVHYNFNQFPILFSDKTMFLLFPYSTR